MVISSSSVSSWCRPAQALIYTDSGEALHFPPLSFGGLPRALTFQDWPLPERRESESRRQIINKTEGAADNAFSPAFYTDGEDQFSFPVRSNTSKSTDEIEDPPEAYESFEIDCTQQPISKNAEEMYMDYGAPYMSTPTECYSNKVKQFQGPPMLKSPLPSGTGSCPASPLIQTGTTAYLSLDELVDLYTKKMEAARQVQPVELNATRNGSVEEEKAPEGMEEPREIDSAQQNHPCRSGYEEQRICCTKAANSISVDRSPSDPTTPLQLMVVDIQKLLQRLDDLFDQDESSRDEDMLFVSVEELESLLNGCCYNSLECEPRYKS